MDLDARLVAWVALSALLIATPGPDTALIIRNALAGGPRASTMSALGVAIGILAWAAAATFGVGILLERSSTAFTILKLGGGAYLCYLGVRSLFSSPPRGELRRTSGVPAPQAREGSREGRSVQLGDRHALAQGLFSNLLNPKTGAFFVTVMPQFIVPGDPSIRLVVMVAAFEAMLLAWLIAYGHVVSRLGRSGLGSRVRLFMTKLTGVVLIGLGARLAFERR
jgi:threonine/homoserine/homoserine lactone efflux protein